MNADIERIEALFLEQLIKEYAYCLLFIIDAILC